MGSEVRNLLLVSGVQLLSIFLTYFIALRKMKPEIDKMRSESIESLSEAAESNLQGAQISNELLLQRLGEVRKSEKAWRRHAENLEAILRQNKIRVPPFDPLDTDPKIKAIKKP